MEMSRLTQDGAAEPVSRDQILRRERGQEISIFPVQVTTSSIDNLTRLVHISVLYNGYTVLDPVLLTSGSPFISLKCLFTLCY